MLLFFQAKPIVITQECLFRWSAYDPWQEVASDWWSAKDRVAVVSYILKDFTQKSWNESEIDIMCMKYSALSLKCGVFSASHSIILHMHRASINVSFSVHLGIIPSFWHEVKCIAIHAEFGSPWDIVLPITLRLLTCNHLFSFTIFKEISGTRPRTHKKKCSFIKHWTDWNIPTGDSSQMKVALTEISKTQLRSTRSSQIHQSWFSELGTATM